MCVNSYVLARPLPMGKCDPTLFIAKANAYQNLYNVSKLFKCDNLTFIRDRGLMDNRVDKCSECRRSHSSSGRKIDDEESVAMDV